MSDIKPLRPELEGITFPEMPGIDLKRILMYGPAGDGKCSHSCPRNVETGECAHCDHLRDLLDNGIELEYADGSKEVLGGPGRQKRGRA